ncbi:MAG: hypothetical protein KAI43_02680 [Candidatus Aureabacteria bacterium]|nr:hypothetical protein [Candidatus Auribacterota bacterium]
MAKKKILSIGSELAIDHIEYCNFTSDTSLLDWDIILFKPEIYDLVDYENSYKGKPSLSDRSSFSLKEHSEHWRREIKDAVETGKTVIVFLADLYEVFIDSGKREYSGTGRNQQTTKFVKEYNNYRCIPADINPVKTKGSAMKLAPRGAELLASYWKEFEEDSQYKLILTGENIPASITTKNGNKPVGAIYKSKNSNGALLLVPDIDFCKDEYFEEEDEDQVWSEAAVNFASRMLKAVVSLDKALKTEGQSTPEPEWTKTLDYELMKETSINSELLKTEEALEKIQKTKDCLLDKLRDLSRLRNLLFEKGKPLEYAVIDALIILGFKAKHYKDSESEFDVVFESTEGRLIGEAEGKDNKAINIDKLRQLEMNIHEDLEREEVSQPAKAVLFGNAYRLEPLVDRADPFTTKCISAAKRSSTALAFTPDLFMVARYLSNKKDARFATRCRKVIISSVGRVVFPDTPASTDAKQKKTKGVSP